MVQKYYITVNVTFYCNRLKNIRKSFLLSSLHVLSWTFSLQYANYELYGKFVAKLINKFIGLYSFYYMNAS